MIADIEWPWGSGMRRCLKIHDLVLLVALFPCVLSGLRAQQLEGGTSAPDAIPQGGERKLKLDFEQRGRYETRTGNSFGGDADVETGLFRTRIGLTYFPVKWLKFSGMVQDSRAPWYGPNAPSSVRDPADLHEGYFELFPSCKKGFGMTAGRKMLNYGEGRLIGTPQWGNLSRTYDQARLYWRFPQAQLEVLLVSQVMVRIGEFNYPVLGDRVWGTYNVFPNFYKKHLLEAYVLRHDRNRPGGFTGGSSKNGTDKAGVNTFGLRLTGPLASDFKYSLELALQYGKVGPADLRSNAWFSGITRRWAISGRTVDVSGEYKYASGTKNPSDPDRSGTFDQLYAANHDKFGHQDLFGWRNLHNIRTLVVMGVTRNIAINVMYDNYWLASRKDGIYNSSGKLIARSITGIAGSHVGQEADVFGTYKYKHFTFGAGYGYFFPGEFIQKTTPGVGPTYLYVFHTFSL
jgi:alginate export protein